MPTLAVIAFPGNNCEIETQRAAARNGFEAEIVRWNEPEKIGNFDAYILPGGFSFEDRGRSGAISAREEIFDKIRKEAQKGKIILGICNGAQMIVESGLIPVGDNPLPFALAHNIRRDETGHVLGTGFYNTWVHLVPERKDTAFTNSVEKVLHVPIAHGEGRFTSRDEVAIENLENGKNVILRYCDEDGKISDKFPTTPNGALAAVAGIVNEEGTVAAMMPHPERFFDSFDGDQIFQSMRQWIEGEKSPSSVKIGDFSAADMPEIKTFEPVEKGILIEKKLIITDNEAFSVSTAASKVCGGKVQLQKSILFEISGTNVDKQKIVDSGLILNPNKEMEVENSLVDNKFLVLDFQNDEADHLAGKLSEMFGGDFQVRIFKVWNFGAVAEESIQKVLKNRLLANPNSSEILKM